MMSIGRGKTTVEFWSAPSSSEGLEVTQLEACRALAEGLRASRSSARCLEFPLGVDHLGAPLALGLGLRAIARCIASGISTSLISTSTLIPQGSVCTRWTSRGPRSVGPLGQQRVEVCAPDDRTQGGLGDLGRGDRVVLHLITDFTGSTTRKRTTAFTRAGTLSRVITSCGGIVSVTVRRSTRTILSTRQQRPDAGAASGSRNRPSRNATPRSYSSARAGEVMATSSSIRMMTIGPCHRNCAAPLLASGSVGRCRSLSAAGAWTSRRPAFVLSATRPATRWPRLGDREAGPGAAQVRQERQPQQGDDHGRDENQRARPTRAGERGLHQQHQMTNRYHQQAIRGGTEPASECGQESTARGSPARRRGGARALDRAGVADRWVCRGSASSAVLRVERSPATATGRCGHYHASCAAW